LYDNNKLTASDAKKTVEITRGNELVIGWKKMERKQLFFQHVFLCFYDREILKRKKQIEGDSCRLVGASIHY
jgi:hypothetical protein